MAYPYSYNNLRNLQLGNQALQANRDRLAQASQPQSNSPLGLPNTPSPGWIRMQQQKALQDAQGRGTQPNWRNLDGSVATPEQIRDMFGNDLEQNPNIPTGEQNINWDRIFNPANKAKRRQEFENEFNKIGDDDMEMENFMNEMEDKSLRLPNPQERDNIRRSGNPFSNWKMHGDGNPFATPTDEEMNRYKNNQDQFLNKMRHPLNRAKDYILGR